MKACLQKEGRRLYLTAPFGEVNIYTYMHGVYYVLKFAVHIRFIWIVLVQNTGPVVISAIFEDVSGLIT